MLGSNVENLYMLYCELLYVIQKVKLVKSCTCARCKPFAVSR